jgi:YtoQ family protein|tara:strand:+ start:313 stop:762 length:450 start_codon:yes stop_codon:yes gene_type:complete
MIKVYLAGEIHSNWREEIIDLCEKEKLDVKFTSPVTDHESSDNCGVEILGEEEKNFWKDRKGASINSIRIKKSIQDCDVIIVKFGEKYKQWNAAFDAGYAAALNKSIIVIQNDEHQHALKEVDAAAAAVATDQKQAVRILKYVLKGSLK